MARLVAYAPVAQVGVVPPRTLTRYADASVEAGKLDVDVEEVEEVAAAEAKARLARPVVMMKMMDFI